MNCSSAYFLLIGFLVIFLCIVAPPVGTRSRRVRFVSFTDRVMLDQHLVNISPLLRDTLTA